MALRRPLPGTLGSPPGTLGPNRDRDTGREDPAGVKLPPRGAGYTVLSYLLAGMATYGGFGWLAGHALHVPVLFPVGMLVGLAISVGFVIYRYGRS